MRMSAQISVYPMRQEALSPAVQAVCRALEAHGLTPSVGSMSTVVTGDPEDIFPAIREAFDAASAKGDTVLTVTLSNACPT